MVEFGGRYYIDPAQVEYISETDRAGAIVADSHPYDLTVHLLSGKSLGLYYPTKAARDNERRKLVSAIQRERTNYEETGGQRKCLITIHACTPVTYVYNLTNFRKV